MLINGASKACALGLLSFFTPQCFDVLVSVAKKMIIEVPDEKTDCAINLCGIQIRYYRFKESIQADIANADVSLVS